MVSVSFLIVPRQRPIIDDNHEAPLVQILTWLMLSFSILAVAAHLITKRALGRKLGSSDAIIFAALVLAIGQAAALLSPDGQAIGNTQEQISGEDFDRALKVLYSAEMLHILTLVVAKISLLVALCAITPITEHRFAIYSASIVIVIWGITSVFIVAFQCPAPQQWNVFNQGCTDIRSSRTYIAVMDIVTDFCLMVVPSFIIMPVRMSWRKRFTILSGFWFRITTIAVAIVQLIYLRRLRFDIHFLNNLWRPVACQQIIQTLSIMSTCIPFLKPFWASLESGFLRADDLNRRTAGGTSSSALNSSGWTSRYIKIKNYQNWVPSIELQSSATRQEHN
ncbi:hypothetical protein F4810DRAFT_669579 [Camillea tinctor]|nr:hypothetical protein F4810DRAFT_669579 [Camillea tinctor]